MGTETPEKVYKDGILAEQLVAAVLCADCMVDDAKHERLVEAVRHSVREQMGEMYARVLEEHGLERASAALLAHRLAQCTRASKCGWLCRHLMKSPGWR